MGAFAEQLKAAQNGSGSGGSRMFEVSQNIDEVAKLIDTLEDKELIRRIAYRAIIEGAMVLKHYAQEGFKRKLGEASSHPSPYIKGLPFYEGVWIKGNKSDTVKVSIMKDFRMKFFETGTGDRYIKNRSHSDYSKGRFNKNTGKQNFRGSISKEKYGGWFAEARKEGQQAVTQAVVQSINNAMTKIGRGETL